VSTLLRLLMVILPWGLRRRLMQCLYGYRLHASSRIGLAWVFPKDLVMGAGASIGHLTIVKGLDLLALGDHASIGRLNWITAYPSGQPPHFMHVKGRSPRLVLGEHAAVTNRHIIDCTERVVIGRYATVAGFRSQILTHSIDLRACRQDAKAIVIGEYCFVGTACTVLGGSRLPEYSVLGAHALLNRAYEEPYRLYAGVPAKSVANLDGDLAYFTRAIGFVI
jgi:acetyltransferase-like isoleucine patch superfamily enzyme